MFSLIRKVPAEVSFQLQIAWAVELEVTSDDAEVSPAVFVMQVRDTSDVDAGAWFTAVATPSQLDEYPTEPEEIANTPVQQPYFRTNKITLVSRNADDIQILYERILADIELLHANLTALSEMAEPATVTIP